MSTYKDAGVDIDAGDRAVELMKASIAKASRPEVMGGIGGFAGLFDASALKNMKKPLLATSTDGVGTKTEIARAIGKYDTIGEDLVAMVVDDSIVRGNTQRAIVRMLREAGAREIHVRISSPPVKWPCFYGIDFATRAELVASGLEVEEIRRSIGADSLGYVSLEGLIESTQVEENKLCGACFTGQYPIRIPADMSEGKMRLEITEVHGH